MCGIAGFVQRARSTDALARMLPRIAHRGPDGEGQWGASSGEWFMALGHRRLAILDIAGGHQPMSTADARFHLSYNGELYNFRQLRQELEAEGVVFCTRGDTEVLLEHVARRWDAGLAALNGMFAFAVWDQRLRRLLLARDRVGIKPLYYAELRDGGLVFASELTAVLQHPEVARELSPAGLASYFFSDYVHAPLTMIAGVHKLAPGHALQWRDGVLHRPMPFWSLPRGAPVEEREDVLTRELWDRLERATERQLVADVPVGAFLSGGIDSSTIALLAQRRGGRRLQTFSIAFDDPTFDESGHARAVAAHIGSAHAEERLHETNLLEVIDAALACLDEPLADPSYLPTYLLSRLAASQVKVALSGDGGDELFGGYPTYRAHLFADLYARLPEAVRRRLVEALVARLPVAHTYQSLEWKLKRFVLRWDDDWSRRHVRWMSNLDVEDLARALPVAAGRSPITLPSAPADPMRSLDDVQALDFTTYLPGSVLTKVDRASMAHGLEVRPPMLDEEVLDWIWRVPSRFKVGLARSKHLLKLAVRDKLPDAIVARPKKGFGIPLAAWLRGPLRERLARTFEDSSLWASGLLDPRTFRLFARRHADGQADYSKPLWALIVLDEWVRRENIGPGVHEGAISSSGREAASCPIVGDSL